MLMRDTKRFAFELDTLSVLQDDKALAALAERFQPSEGINYVAFTFHGTAPLVNMKAMAITPATMLPSISSALHKQMDFEHRVEDLPFPRDDDSPLNDIVGHIVELSMGDIPDASDKEAWMFAPHIPQEPIITTGVMALFTRIMKVRMIAREVSRGAPWYFSLEIGEEVTPPEIWLKANDGKPHEIIPWNEATEELRQMASQPQLMEFEGRQVAYLMGGADGRISFIGGAITSNPAGHEQRQPGRQLKLIASADGAIQDSVSDKIWQSEKWKKQLKESLKRRKEASNTAEGDSGIISPIFVNDLEELIEMTDVVTELIGAEDEENAGGESKVPKIEIEEEELAKRIADAKALGKSEGDTEGYDRGKTEAGDVLDKAVADGTHIPADQVDGIVAKRLMSRTRETSIDALNCDDDTKADFKSIAGNEEKYPLTEEGQAEFEKAAERWGSSLKTASDDSTDDLDENGNPKKTASTSKGKDFDPGDGGGGDDDNPMDDYMKGGE